MDESMFIRHSYTLWMAIFCERLNWLMVAYLRWTCIGLGFSVFSCAMREGIWVAYEMGNILYLIFMRVIQCSLALNSTSAFRLFYESTGVHRTTGGSWALMLCVPQLLFALLVDIYIWASICLLDFGFLLIYTLTVWLAWKLACSSRAKLYIGIPDLSPGALWLGSSLPIC